MVLFGRWDGLLSNLPLVSLVMLIQQRAIANQAPTLRVLFTLSQGRTPMELGAQLRMITAYKIFINPLAYPYGQYIPLMSACSFGLATKRARRSCVDVNHSFSSSSSRHYLPHNLLPRFSSRVGSRELKGNSGFAGFRGTCEGDETCDQFQISGTGHHIPEAQALIPARQDFVKPAPEKPGD